MDEEITSHEIDDLLDQATMARIRCPADGTQVRLYVAVDADPLGEQP